VQNTAEIKAALERSGMSRLEVAKAIGMPYGTLNSKLNGYYPFTDEESAKILETISVKGEVADAE